MHDTVRANIDGRELTVPAGTTVAAAVFLSGQVAFRTSVAGQPRAALCGMGICFECRVTIDGRPDSRSCQILVKDGMVVLTS
jgi:predicted molibdopterin-dependent oxidoreductase YjgC